MARSVMFLQSDADAKAAELLVAAEDYHESFRNDFIAEVILVLQEYLDEHEDSGE
jgi:hypothetical protein